MLMKLFLLGGRWTCSFALLCYLCQEARGLLLGQRVQYCFCLYAQRVILIIYGSVLLLKTTTASQRFETLLIVVVLYFLILYTLGLVISICLCYVLCNNEVNLLTLVGVLVSWLVIQELTHLLVLNFVQDSL